MSSDKKISTAASSVSVLADGSTPGPLLGAKVNTLEAISSLLSVTSTQSSSKLHAFESLDSETSKFHWDSNCDALSAVIRREKFLLSHACGKDDCFSLQKCAMIC